MSITKRDIQASILKMKMKKHCKETNTILREKLKMLNIRQTTWMRILKGNTTSFKNIVTLVNEIKYFTYDDFVQILNLEGDNE